MTLSSIDLTRRLDELEQQLPLLPAKSVALGRATVRRTNDMVSSVVSNVARRMDRVVSTARSGAATTSGQAKSAMERTTEMGERSAKRTVGQARSAAERTAKVAQTGVRETVGQARTTAKRTAKVAQTGVRETVGQARTTAKRTSKTARSTAKQTAGQARAQTTRTADVAATEAGALIDDATQALDPDATHRGVAYEKWTKSDLYDRAQELDIDGHSKMSKQQLITALRST